MNTTRMTIDYVADGTFTVEAVSGKSGVDIVIDTGDIRLAMRRINKDKIKTLADALLVAASKQERPQP